ncbi:putative HD_domain domain-containing protein [Vibrio chagasii]|nr:putative HD_domain domain-containing protein [Vibrio chagasii]
MLHYSEKPQVADFISKYGSVHPLLNQFEFTMQDPEWHGEGSVLVHTDMVLSEIYKLLDDKYFADRLNEKEKQILMFSAAYHDYAKPITTKPVENNGVTRIRSPKHEDIGAAQLLFSSIPDELNFEDWLCVVRLIYCHQLPKRIVKNSFSYGKMVRALFDSGSLKLLHILSIADFKGRVCSDMDSQLDYLELFEMECDEIGLLDTDSSTFLKDMVSDLYSESSTGLIASVESENIIPKRVLGSIISGRIGHHLEGLSLPYNYDKFSEVYIMCGLSGSGKSEKAAVIASERNAEIISLDEIRGELSGNTASQSVNTAVRREAEQRLRQALRDKRNVVWDATSLRVDFRTKVSGLVSQYGGYSELVVVCTPLNVCVARDKARNRQVGEFVISSQLSKFQFPSIGEVDWISYVL